MLLSKPESNLLSEVFPIPVSLEPPEMEMLFSLEHAGWIRPQAGSDGKLITQLVRLGMLIRDEGHCHITVSGITAVTILRNG